MTIKIKKDLCTGILACILATAIWLLIPIGIKSKVTIETNAVGPDYMPRLLCIVTFVIGILLVIKSLVLKRDTIETVELKQEKNVFIFTGIVLVCVILIQFVGFLISSMLLAATSFVLFKEKNKLYYVIILSVCVVVYALFKYLLGVPLP